MSQQLGDPDRYAQFLDQLVPEVRLAAIAEIEQAVEHWRAAGWNDLAIGALVVLSGCDKTYRDFVAIQALRRVV